ncbi:hypothetical protein [Caldimonas taiwanensis]|uniref:hypothetical protein n=1 Tax=Caldimonas taiwanensis TaxID=307483 RepID=UPI0007862826|nr:hypothetical protein [Caldimonas taiwanensis]
MNVRRIAFCLGGALALAVCGVTMAQSSASVKKSTKAAPSAAALSLAPATPEQLEAAARVYVGRSDCEFGQHVTVTPHPDHAGYFTVTLASKTWVVKPVLSSTGALRMEDVRGQALYLQITDKSMLMNTALGYRVADNCVHPKHREAMATHQRESIGIAAN